MDAEFKKVSGTSLESGEPVICEEADEAVVAVDITNNVLVDPVTDMSTNPDLIASAEVTSDTGDDSKLTLAYERLYEIPKAIVEKFSDHVKYLDISHNKISNLNALVHFKHLTSLIADGNPITENSFLPPLPKLQLLWLNRCKIASLYPWVGKLKESCPDLKYLCLMGNPAAPSYLNGGTFYEYLQYRLFLIAQFPSLTHLDDRKVNEDQKTEAERLYKRPFLDRLLRPGANSISQIMKTPVTWSNVREKLSFWGKETVVDRNRMI